MKITSFIGLGLITALLLSCSETGNGTISLRDLTGTGGQTKDTLTITATNGTVTKSPDKSIFKTGDTVTLTAVPNSGYRFSGWAGDASGTSATTTLTMNGNQHVVAYFSQISNATFLLTITGTNGSVTKSPDKSSYTSGDMVTLTAHPTSGYSFEGWSGDTTYDSSVFTFIISKDVNLNMSFSLLPRPMIASVIAGDRNVAVSWSNVGGATGYNLYYTAGSSVDKTGTKIAAAVSPTMIASLRNNTQYAIAVSAVNAKGESNLSDFVLSMPIPPPAAPVIASAVGKDGSISVTWGAVSGATSYNLYYTVGNTVTKSNTKATAVTSPYTVTGLTNGTVYAVAVSAVNSAGESELSVVGTTTPVPVPTAPVTTSIVGGDGTVTVTWVAVSGATSYNLYYTTGTTVTKSNTMVTGAISPYTITGLINGTQYAIAVSAVNAAGESGLSVAGTVTPIPIPAAPVISSAVGGDGNVTITWSAVSGATSYNLYYATGTTVTVSGTKMPTVTSPYVITGLASGTQYAMVISAVNPTGESGLSGIKTATTIPGVPVISSTIGGGGQITVTWSAVSGATSYNLYYATGATVTTSGTKVTGVSSPYSVTGLANGTQYAVAVSAVNSAGESGLSGVGTAATISDPSTPSISSVVGGNGQITVTWSTVTDAISYNLYYAVGATVTKSGTKVTGVTSSYSISGLSNGTQYAVAVSAVNTAGESGLSGVGIVTLIPSVPVISSTIGGDRKVTITWSMVSGATAYNIYYATGTMVTMSGTKMTAVASPYSITGLANGTSYAVAMSAVNSGGESELSGVSLATAQNIDIDGNVYHTVIIGTQEWMVENLRTTKYNDGTSIPLITATGAWSALTTPGYCYYNNDSVLNKVTYGVLYNWYAVNTGKLAPIGWHVPTDAEWTTLTTYLGGEFGAGGKLKETGTTRWSSPNTGATNVTGFTALPGGYRGTNGAFSIVGYYGGWWSASANNTTNAWNRYMYYGDANVSRYSNYCQFGYSIRCVRD